MPNSNTEPSKTPADPSEAARDRGPPVVAPSRQKEKDLWDKAQIISGFLASVVIAVVGILINISIQRAQINASAANTQAQIAVAERNNKAQLALTERTADIQRHLQEASLIGQLAESLAGGSAMKKQLAIVVLRRSIPPETYQDVITLIVRSEADPEVRKTAISDLNDFVMKGVRNATRLAQTPGLAVPSGGADPIILGPDAKYSKIISIAIGISAYNPEVGPLKFPVTNAQEFNKFWQSQGAETTLRTNATWLSIMNTLRSGNDKADGGSLHLFYYSGHAFSDANGMTWLVPIDVNLERYPHKMYQNYGLGARRAQNSYFLTLHSAH